MPNESSRFPISRGAGVLAGALLMTWPALFNRYPLLFPDSMTYLEGGRPTAQALFLHNLSDYYGMRSVIYSLGIFPFHWNVTLWPIVALNALVTAFVIWLVVRSILQRQTMWCYLVLCALLSLLTSLSWFVGLIMPDILTPVLCLSIYLLVFARETLSRVERLAVILIAGWAVASHATHLMIACGICVVLILPAVLRWQSMHRRLRAVGEVAMIVLLAAAAQVALNMYLNDDFSLYGDRPPFLMARVIADGPGRRYLEQHCVEPKYAICEDVHDLPDSTDSFLWSSDGVWERASEEKQMRLRREEIPFVLATIRTYPREQLLKSAVNFWQQLTTFGLNDLGSSKWLLKEFDQVLPKGRSSYLKSRQVRNALSLDFFTSVQICGVIGSLVVICLLAPYILRRRPARLIGLGLIIVATVIFNAFLTGVISGPEDRYQGRVIWLLPFLAGVLALDWRNFGKRAEP